MKATVTHEEIGKTPFGDPEILVTTQAPHPKAGFQLLLRSTASMDHMQAKMTKTGKTSYMVYQYEAGDDYASRSGWLGAFDGATVEEVVGKVARFVGWLHVRETIRDNLEISELSEHLGRFYRGLWENYNIDYQEEWRNVLAEVARINLIMAEVEDDDEQ